MGQGNILAFNLVHSHNGDLDGEYGYTMNHLCRDKYWPLKSKPTGSFVAPLIVALCLIPLSAHAESSQNMGGGTQKMGSRLGQFMGSFMEGLEPPSTTTDKSKILPKLKEKIESPLKQSPKNVPGSSTKGWQQRSSQNVYDPWRATQQNRRRTAPIYDPWGVTGNNRDLTRFADRDWRTGRKYYEAPLGSWESPGERRYPSSGFAGGSQNWRRPYNGYTPNNGPYPNSGWGGYYDDRPSWPTVPNQYPDTPYGANGYDQPNRPGWNW
jgi:hypothetical protein